MRGTLPRPWWRQPPRKDASTIMGMHTAGAAITALGIWGACVIIGFAAGGVTGPLYYLGAMIILLGAVCVLLGAPRDPVVPWGAAVIMLAPPAAILLAIPGLTHRPGMAYATLSGVSVIVVAFLAVRGRSLAAWGGYALSVLVAVIADHVAGPLPTLISALAPNLAVVLMATIFAAIVRPRARQIFALRAETERETALRAAEEATLAVRDQQLSRLDDGARPLLDRIAEGNMLSDAELRRCRLVEAQLRDRIRAPGFDSPGVARAAWRARARDVRVLLLDDFDTSEGGPRQHGFDVVVNEVITVLERAESGDEIIARLLPNGRAAFATISVRDPAGLTRLDFDLDGHRTIAQTLS